MDMDTITAIASSSQRDSEKQLVAKVMKAAQGKTVAVEANVVSWMIGADLIRGTKNPS